MVYKLIKRFVCKVSKILTITNIESYIEVFAVVDNKFLPMRVQFSQQLALD